MQYTRTISEDTIRDAVATVAPGWTVLAATAATGGHHAVYHVDVATPDGRRECVLKATPAEKEPTCGDEARLLAILGEHTGLPVPYVHGVVDEADGLPTPFFLAEALDGTNHGPTAVASLSPRVVDRLARSTGRHLATLHALDVVDSYGFVAVGAADAGDGEPPSSDRSQVTVQGSDDDWIDHLSASATGLADALGETRFADLESTVRTGLDRRIDALEGPFEPALCRIDSSLDNLLLAEDGVVTGSLDWEFCVAAPPAYDLAFVEHSLAGGIAPFAVGGPDYRDRIRTELVAGYRAEGDRAVVDAFEVNRDCYALLADVHAALNYETWFDHADVPEGAREGAERPLRERLRSRCRA